MSSRHPNHLAEMIRQRTRVADTQLALAGGAPVIDPGTGGAVITDVLTILAVFDGGGTVISADRRIDVVVDAACTIEAWTMLADVSTTARIDIWRDVVGAFPPTSGDSMPGAIADRPQLAAGLSARDDVLGWDRVIVDAGDILRFNVDTNNNATRLSIALKARRAS